MDVRLKRIRNLLHEVELSLGMLQQLLLAECLQESADEKRRRLLDRVANLLDQIKNDEITKLHAAVGEVEPCFQDCRIGILSKKLAERYFHSHTSAEFLDAAVDLLMAETRSERAAIVLCLGKPGEVEVVCARNFQSRDLSADEHALSRTLLNRAISLGDALLVKDVQTDPTYSYETSLIQRHVRSALVAPLRIGSQVLGAIYLDNSSIVSVYSEADGEFLKGIGQIIAVYLDATDRLQAAMEAKDAFRLDAQAGAIQGEIVGNSPPLQQLRKVIAQVAASSATVLIEGESGSGKELVARALHAASPRAQRAFVVVNCAALPETLAESVLFGHERGAFTDAFERKIGRLEQADGGTLFLDEVGELPLTVQAKLLRFLQSQEFERLGGVKTIKVDARVLAATSRQLERMVAEGRFLEALFYRLNVVPIRVPPLRERKEDIPLLANYFLRKFASAAGRFPMKFHPEALLALEA
ncbi:MAG: sigma-54-dependent Fis family transcriptional regulator, partial [candidate division WOR-3 bacterium]